jgi:hypothetical protein
MSKRSKWEGTERKHGNVWSRIINRAGHLGNQGRIWNTTIN